MGDSVQRAFAHTANALRDGHKDAAARAMLAALIETESLLAELAEGGAENPELETIRAAIAQAEAAGIATKRGE